MRLYLGDYAFQDNSCLVTSQTRAILSPQGRIIEHDVTVFVRGELVVPDGTSNPQNWLILQQELLKAAFLQRLPELVLRTASGSSSGNGLTNNNSVTGVRIINYAFPDGGEGELVSKRAFEFVANARYPAGVLGAVLSFSETLSIDGTGGPLYVLKPSLEHRAVYTRAQKFTTVSARQLGTAVGYDSYPNFPPPLWGVPILKPRPYVRDFMAPQLQGLRQTNWGIRWDYSFESNGPLRGLPHLSPPTKAG